MMATPLFLSLDGIDGTGKSTQCRLLADWLRARGLSVTQCTDPGGTAIGSVLRELVLRHCGDMTTACEAFLFMASRSQLVAEVIRPALDRGEVVVSDRYLLANVVYQGYAGGLDVDQLWQMGRLATGGLIPNLTLVLDLPLDVAMSRRGREPDRMENKTRSFHEKVREGFLTEARRQSERIRIVDATPSVEIVHEQICKEVEHVLAARPRA
jgi:dTMP kinase